MHSCPDPSQCHFSARQSFPGRKPLMPTAFRRRVVTSVDVTDAGRQASGEGMASSRIGTHSRRLVT